MPPSNRKSGTSLTSTYGKLHTPDASKKLWLARLPNKLATLWDEAPEGTLLGHMTFTKGSARQKLSQQRKENDRKDTVFVPQKLSINVSEKLAQKCLELPLDYTLTNITSKIPTYHPYSRYTNGSVKVHGVISRSCNLQMERSQRYRLTCKTRLLNSVAGKDKRHVKPMQNTNLGVVNNIGSIGSGFGSTIATFGKKIIDAQKDIQHSQLIQNRKRKFDETQSVRSVLFELFSQQKYWSVKELRGASGGRAEKEIRVELGQIAEFKRAGEYKGQWELKKEFASSIGSSMNGGISSGR